MPENEFSVPINRIDYHWNISKNKLVGVTQLFQMNHREMTSEIECIGIKIY